MHIHSLVERPDWVLKGLGAAEHFATWSKDPSTQVGAVILSRRNRVIGVGYNGFPSRMKDDPARLADRALKNADTIHAEINAVLNATADVEGCPLFVSHPPCGECALFLSQVGVSEVHYRTIDPVSGFYDRWATSIERADGVFRRARMTAYGWDSAGVRQEILGV